MNSFIGIKLSALLFSSLLIFSACEKDDDTPEETPPPTSTPENADTSVPPPSDAAGLMMATAVFTTVNQFGFELDYEVGTATAIFAPDGDFSAPVTAGDVSLSGNALGVAGESNVYVYTPGATNPTGINLDDDHVWTVSGANGVPSITHTTSTFQPYVASFTSSTDISKSSNYTLSCTGVSNADSVYFTIGTVVKVRAGSVLSCEFTADELSVLPTGPSIAQIAPYNLESAMYGGAKYYFGKQASRSVTVNITD